MNLKEYSDFVQDYSDTGYPKRLIDNTLPSLALGLAGETGEVIEHIKKYLRDGKTVIKAELTEELGDVIAYTVLLCNYFNIDVDAVLNTNKTKLSHRQQSNTQSSLTR